MAGEWAKAVKKAPSSARDASKPGPPGLAQKASLEFFSDSFRGQGAGERSRGGFEAGEAPLSRTVQPVLSCVVVTRLEVEV